MSNFDKEFLNTLTIQQLKYICRTYNARVRGYSKMSKEQLVDVVSTLATFEYNKDNLPIKIVRKPRQPRQPKQPRQKKQPKSVYKDLEVPEYTPYKSKYDAEYEDIIKQFEYKPPSRRPSIAQEQPKKKKIIKKDIAKPRIIEQEQEPEQTTHNFNYLNSIVPDDIYNKIEQIKNQDLFIKITELINTNKGISKKEAQRYREYLNGIEILLMELQDEPQAVYNKLIYDINNMDIPLSDKNNLRKISFTIQNIINDIDNFIKDIDVMRGDLYMIS